MDGGAEPGLDLALINTNGMLTGRSTDGSAIVLDVGSGSYSWVDQRGGCHVHRCQYAQHAHLRQLHALVALHNAHVDRPYICKHLEARAGSITTGGAPVRQHADWMSRPGGHHVQRQPDGSLLWVSADNCNRFWMPWHKRIFRVSFTIAVPPERPDTAVAARPWDKASREPPGTMAIAQSFSVDGCPPRWRELVQTACTLLDDDTLEHRAAFELTVPLPTAQVRMALVQLFVVVAVVVV